MSWGLFRARESEIRLLGDVAGARVVELGCGTAYLVGVVGQSRRAGRRRRSQPRSARDRAALPTAVRRVVPARRGERRARPSLAAKRSISSSASTAPDRGAIRRSGSPKRRGCSDQAGGSCSSRTACSPACACPRRPASPASGSCGPSGTSRRIAWPGGGIEHHPGTATGSACCARPASSSTRCTSCTRPTRGHARVLRHRHRGLGEPVAGRGRVGRPPAVGRDLTPPTNEQHARDRRRFGEVPRVRPSCAGGGGSSMSSMSRPASPIACTYRLSGRWTNSSSTPGATVSTAMSSTR